MRRRPPAKFRVVAAEEAMAATGLRLPALLGLPDVQRLTRIRDGRHEDAVRVPVELLPEPEPEPEPEPKPKPKQRRPRVPRRDVRRDGLLERIVAVLGEAGGVLLREELASRVGVSGASSNLARVLQLGVGEGLLARERRGRMVAYRLAPEAVVADREVAR